MKKDREHLSLYLVTDRRWTDRPLEEIVEEAIRAGVTMVQLREKDMGLNEFVELGKRVKKVTDSYNIPFVINDRVEVAKAIDADGVHIGQGDMDVREAREILGKEKIIGVSASNLDEAKRAEKDSADYLGVGALFPTGTKDDADHVSYEALKEIVENTGIPVVGIGGIDKDNIEDLRGSNISGVAVISAILKEKDIERATGELYRLSREVFYGGSNL